MKGFSALLLRVYIPTDVNHLHVNAKRHTKAIGAFPDGQSALMLICARLRYVAGTPWGAKRYMNMEYLYEMDV